MYETFKISFFQKYKNLLKKKKVKYIRYHPILTLYYCWHHQQTCRTDHIIDINKKKKSFKKTLTIQTNMMISVNIKWFEELVSNSSVSRTSVKKKKKFTDTYMSWLDMYVFFLRFFDSLLYIFLFNQLRKANKKRIT